VFSELTVLCAKRTEIKSETEREERERERTFNERVAGGVSLTLFFTMRMSCAFPSLSRKTESFHLLSFVVSPFGNNLRKSKLFKRKKKNQ
jgi:hypothetical protein